MALVINDRVKETSTTTGTGTIDLAGAETGYESFVSGVGTGNTTYYAIELNSANEWEVGIATVNFSAGTKNVFCTLPAKKTISPVMDATTFVVTHASTLSEDQTLDSGVLAGPVTITGTQTITGTLVVI